MANNSNIDFTRTSITKWEPTGLIEYYDHNGNVVTSVLVCVLTLFIETRELNDTGETTQGDLVFFGGYDSENEYDSIPVVITPMQYLEDSFESVTEQFYNEVLLQGKGLSHAA